MVFLQSNALHVFKQLKLQTRLRNATAFEKQKLAAEYMDFMRSKDINPLKALLYQLPTGLIFMSFFVGLRGMAQVKSIAWCCVDRSLDNSPYAHGSVSLFTM